MTESGEAIFERVRQNLAVAEGSLNEIQSSLPRTISWIQREWMIANQNHARALLTGAKISLLEAGTAWAIGSNRGAASSLRVFTENTIAWLYYKDHPVEYNMVIVNGADLLLPKAVQSYLKLVDLGFEKNYSLLSKYAKRSTEYFYTAVSQFVHAHPAFAADHLKLEESAISVPRDPGFLKLVEMTDEFISDCYAVVYRHSWDDLPVAARADIELRLGAKVSSFLN
ncbi:hypothetical protein AFCDBAGC_5118 [Methylobacterium cerastii]|uniref:Uncharacterized protein n=1 Tax=Methylobacterium cerastii TaxID=932741 RepID=A0ABQ4QR87_9HYPH|nr:hypothetical protein [Methylobacterium cerastii]GJD47226.1 hypothetical protein AFCDBAGC_5118 [Methylobacterium cerastii]